MVTRAELLDTTLSTFVSTKTKLIDLAFAKAKRENLEDSQDFIVITENYFIKSCQTSPEGLTLKRYGITSLILKNILKPADERRIPPG